MLVPALLRQENALLLAYLIVHCERRLLAATDLFASDLNSFTHGLPSVSAS
jgi:hypothetical protein